MQRVYSEIFWYLLADLISVPKRYISALFRNFARPDVQKQLEDGDSALSQLDVEGLTGPVAVFAVLLPTSIKTNE